MQDPPQGPGYGTPPPSSYPSYPPQPPYPGYGAPPAAPQPQYPDYGYGAPPQPQYPSQYPQYPAQPGYAPPSTPLPGYPAQPGYAPPSTPLPGYPPQGYGMPQYPGAPTPSGGSPLSRSRTAIIVGVVVVLLLLVGGVVRYNGPVDTVKGFLSDLYVNFNAHAAISRVCPDQQNTFLGSATIDQAQATLDQQRGKITVDLSGLSYSIADEGLSDAHVKLAGSIKASGQGITSSNSTVSLNATEHLKSSGLGWCMENPDDIFRSSSS